MSRMMKAAQFLKVGRLRIIETPVPQAGAGQVLVRVQACGVCGTDKHILEGVFPSKPPVILGHECAGVVKDIGAGVGSVSVGDTVVLDPNRSCYNCEACRAGKRHLCSHLLAHGVDIDGAFAEFCVVGEREVYPVENAKADFEELALVEPLSCSLHGIERAGITNGVRVVIMGAGTIGLLMTQLSRLAGASEVVVTDPVEMKRNLAVRLGADAACATEDLPRLGYGEQCADVVLECAGTPATARMVVRLLRSGGTGLFFGVCNQEVLVSISPFEVYRRELSLKGSFTQAFEMQRAIELITSCRVDVKPLITHRFPLAQVGQAIQRVGSPDCIKPVIATSITEP